ncbi:hypothetical protein EDD15DRAFT_2199314 [Pisolithus albus]|nr:hypothetical protein EDD15DRAFT_2199314 [Pisolithus albus]
MPTAPSLQTCGKMKERMARNNGESPLMDDFDTSEDRYDGLTQSYSPAVDDGAASSIVLGRPLDSRVELVAVSLRRQPKARPSDALQHVGKLTRRKDIHAEANNLDTSEKRYDGLTQSYSPAVDDGARSTFPKGNVALQLWSIVLLGSKVNLTAISLRIWPKARLGDALQHVGKLTLRKDIHADAPRKYLLKITLMTSADEIDIEDDVSSSLFLLVGTRSKVVDGWSKTQEKGAGTLFRTGTTYDGLPGTSHGCYTFALQAFPPSYSREPPTDRLAKQDERQASPPESVAEAMQYMFGMNRPVICPEKAEDVVRTSLFERDQ